MRFAVLRRIQRLYAPQAGAHQKSSGEGDTRWSEVQAEWLQLTEGAHNILSKATAVDPQELLLDAASSSIVAAT